MRSGSPVRSVPRAPTGSGSCFRSSATTLGFRLLRLHRPFWRNDLAGDDIVRYPSSDSLSVNRRERDRSLSHRRLGRAAVGDGDQRSRLCRVPHKREKPATARSNPATSVGNRQHRRPGSGANGVTIARSVLRLTIRGGDVLRTATAPPKY